MRKTARRFFMALPIILAFALLLPAAIVQAAETDGAQIQQSQKTEPVYALPGVFRAAVNQPYDTELVISSGDVYAIVGETPAVEKEKATTARATMARVCGARNTWAGIKDPTVTPSRKVSASTNTPPAV